MTLKVRYIPGKRNVIAYSLSRRRQIIHTEWTLHRKMAKLVIRKWEKPWMDLFATSANKQMEHYFSPIRDDQARGEDALAQSWEGMDAYAYPPAPILHAVLGKIRTEKSLKVTLIAPYAPKAVWFPELLELLVEKPFIIPPI